MAFFKGSVAVTAGAALVLLFLFAANRNVLDSTGERIISARLLQDEEAGCETMATDAYFHIINRQSKLLLPNSLGNNIFQWYTHDSWRFEDSGGGYYHIIGQDSGLALSIDGFGPASLIQEPSDFDITREDWCFILLTGGFYQIKNRNSGLSLDATVNWGLSSAAEPISQWWYYGGVNQHWSVEYDEHHDLSTAETTPPPIECAAFPPNTFYHIIGKQSNLALTVVSQSTDSGANVVQDVASTVPSGHWRMVPTDSGYYQLHVQHSGMTLQPEEVWIRNVVQDQASPSDIDDWCFLPADDGYYSIINRLTDIALDVDGYSTTPGGNIHTWENYFVDNQLFRVETADGTDPEVGTHAPINASSALTTSTAISDWQGPFATPVVAVAMANLPDGKILMWSAYTRDEFGYYTGETMTAIFDPVNESFYEKLVTETQHDMFCPGTSTLADGRIMITGGADAEKVSFYDPAANAWSVGPEMVIPRGYQTNTVLADGSVFLLGGSWNGAAGVNKAGEIWSPITNEWTLLTGVPVAPEFLTADIGGVYRSDNHVWLFTAPNGKVFHAGPSIQTHWIDTSGVGSFTDSIVRGTEDRMSGSAQIFDTGLILVAGGAPNYDSGAGTKEAYIIDINNDIATVKRVGDMEYARTLCNGVVLPSGETVVIGGQSDTLLFSNDNAVYAAEIFDPVAETFTTLGSMTVERTYHGAAILMKDGRVVAAGGGLCGGCEANHRDMEFLTPPYLLDASGALAERSTISSYTPSALPGGTISVTVDRNQIHTFALVRTSAVTHSVNTDQRRIPLPATQSGTTFTMTLPANPNVSIAGIYYLFAMDAAGVPSIAVDFKILL